MIALVAGCASSGVKNPSGVPVTHMNADEQGFVAGTGMESQDLVMVTDKMARSILGIQQIANATTPPTIVLDPVDNQTRFPINKEIFLTRIRAQLNSKARGKVMFLARSQMEVLEKERNRKREGSVTASSDPDRPGVQGCGLLPDRQSAGVVHAHQSGHQRLYSLCVPAHRRPDERYRVGGLGGDEEAGFGRRGVSLGFRAGRCDETILAADVAGCFPGLSRLRHDGEKPGCPDR